LRDYQIEPERIELDLGFGRGIGFYSEMIFEITAPGGETALPICGGGRYDGLARVLGSARDARGVGFAFGLERLAAALPGTGPRGREDWSETWLVIPRRPEDRPRAIQLVTRLRLRGLTSILSEPQPVESALDLARAHRAQWALLVSSDEHGPPAIAMFDARAGAILAPHPDWLDRVLTAEGCRPA
jgi:histidyl-tRNA synthetase